MKLIEEIKSYGIDLSDLTVNENFCLYESNVNEIHGLIGADYAGKLFTGEIKNLPSGLVAMNTYFGWTVMGRTGEGCSASEVLLSLHVRDLKICDLWSLDLLGIKEPSISQSKSEIEEAVKDHFVLSLRRDDEGRYQVSLPWLEVHPELSDNRNIAERRLKSCVRSLQKRNCLQEYENIFKEWVSEKIIEPVEPEELAREKGHFLPHRLVFKENSTTRIRPVFETNKSDPLSCLYNKLSTQLRALSSLGVTSEMCGVILYPLVESSLPINVLRSFERQRKSLENELKLSSLDAIIHFLKNEVETEEKIRLSRTDIFHFSSERKNAAPANSRDRKPSATELFISHKSNDNLCMFCFKNHETRSCKKAYFIPLDEKAYSA
ncbi:integrase catalytic domain-containing protein [Trichonephila clavata]|uniref:Integrase catalytic domain-containing protein n=1 Tax=Trichonephila clavata TaxID=2740835 RepID=A0A8X6KC83_TRICU|nr:integrase catalytic domain-containing protein [Trichonephila clavata]